MYSSHTGHGQNKPFALAADHRQSKDILSIKIKTLKAGRIQARLNILNDFSRLLLYFHSSMQQC